MPTLLSGDGFGPAMVAAAATHAGSNGLDFVA